MPATPDALKKTGIHKQNDKFADQRNYNEKKERKKHFQKISFLTDSVF